MSVNPDKSAIYFGGLSEEHYLTLANSLGMPIGELPFRYLGVLLSHKKLTITQCMPLVDKISKQVKHWACRSLTYAARVVLIKSVLSSLKGFWS